VADYAAKLKKILAAVWFHAATLSGAILATCRLRICLVIILMVDLHGVLASIAPASVVMPSSGLLDGQLDPHPSLAEHVHQRVQTELADLPLQQVVKPRLRDAE
jgi:hypothetical protein